MYALATGTISILRGTTTDAFGDETDTERVLATGVLASIIPFSERVFTPDSPTPRIVRSYNAICGSQTDVTDGDRIRDERTGQIYVVLDVVQDNAPGLIPDKELSLRRVN